MSHIKIIEADITTMQVDVIVNAANPKMLGGGGVDGAIHRAAGPKLLEECRKIKPELGIRCPFGQARITPSGNLLSRYVIHTTGPIYRNQDNPKHVLISTYINTLDLALENNCLSIAFPAISCGAYGYPHEEAAQVALECCNKDEYKKLQIIFCLQGSDMLGIWSSVLEGLLQN